MPRAKKRWVLYILECADGSLYTGITNNVTSRLKRHNAGTGAKYTRGRTPVRLVYSETCPSRGSALQREFQVKRLSRIRKMAIIDGSP